MKNYNQFINEGITDKMKPVQDEEVRDSLSKLSIGDWISKVNELGLDKSYLPNPEDIKEYLRQLPVSEWITKISRTKVLDDKSYLPNSEDVKNLSPVQRLDAIRNLNYIKKQIPDFQINIDEIMPTAEEIKSDNTLGAMRKLINIDSLFNNRTLQVHHDVIRPEMKKYFREDYSVQDYMTDQELESILKEDVKNSNILDYIIQIEKILKPEFTYILLASKDSGNRYVYNLNLRVTLKVDDMEFKFYIGSSNKKDIYVSLQNPYNQFDDKNKPKTVITPYYLKNINDILIGLIKEFNDTKENTIKERLKEIEHLNDVYNKILKIIK